MNINNEITKVIDTLCEKFGIAVDWTSTNVLPYIETLFSKFIKWEIVTSIYWIIFWVLLAGILWLISIPIIKEAYKAEWDFDYSGWPVLAALIITVACVVTIVAVVNIGIKSYDIIEVINFPEKTVYDYIVNQMN